MKLKETTYHVYIPSRWHNVDTIIGDKSIKPWLKENCRTPLSKMHLWYRGNSISVTHRETGKNICEFIAIN